MAMPAVPPTAPGQPAPVQPGPVQNAYNAAKNAPGAFIRRTDQGFTQVASDIDNSSGWNNAAKILSPAYGMLSTQRSFWSGFLK